MRHAAHEAARSFLDGFAEDLVNTNNADFEGRLEEWTAQGFPELAFYRGDRPRGRGEIIAEIRKAQRALDGDTRALAQATRDELPVLAGALRVVARSLTDEAGGESRNVAGADAGERPPVIYRDDLVVPSLPPNEPSTAKQLLPARPRPRPDVPPPMILNPTGGQRRDDSRGGGAWDSDRGDRKHRATDLESTPGQFVASPITGRITKIGYVYGKDKEDKINPDEPTYRSIHIEGTGQYKGLKIKLLYVDGSMVKVGDVVSMGSAVGRSQDIRKRYGASMTPHTHMQAYWHGEPIDPETILMDWQYDGL